MGKQTITQLSCSPHIGLVVTKCKDIDKIVLSKGKYTKDKSEHSDRYPVPKAVRGEDS